jgi:hypothetical protein
LHSLTPVTAGAPEADGLGTQLGLPGFHEGDREGGRLHAHESSAGPVGAKLI